MHDNVQVTVIWDMLVQTNKEIKANPLGIIIKDKKNIFILKDSTFHYA